MLRSAAETFFTLFDEKLNEAFHSICLLFVFKFPFLLLHSAPRKSKMEREKSIKYAINGIIFYVLIFSLLAFGCTFVSSILDHLMSLFLFFSFLPLPVLPQVDEPETKWWCEALDKVYSSICRFILQELRGIWTRQEYQIKINRLLMCILDTFTMRKKYPG